MTPQPYKKALKHLEKAENFQERLADHLKEVRAILEKEQKNHSLGSKPKMKKNRRLK